MNASTLTIEQIPVRSRTLEPAQYTNVYLLANATAAVIIDAGFIHAGEIQKIERAWHAVQKPPVKGILVTHSHQDHISGLTELATRFQAPVYAHPGAQQAIIELNPGLGVNELQAEQIITFGDDQLTVLGTPGHASDHLAFWLPRQQVLFCGDLISGHGTVAIMPPDGDMRAYIKSVRRILALAPTRLAPGHGPWLDTPQQTLQELIDHRLQREQQILKLLDAGPQTPRELAELIYAGEIPDTLLTVAARTVHAHLLKCVADGKIEALTDNDMSITRYRHVK